ncbi:trypsin-like serine protease [Streptomyces sp. NPDC056269]|uniref:S1 family peptidase n=1 Tax=Streptomyces sp. NPDC056269 TaxID=3345768 RepID=UPI0035DB5780
MSAIRPRAAAVTSLVALSLAAATLTAPASAVSGTASANTSYRFTAKLAIGNTEATMRNCSGALVNPRWVLTASSCFTTEDLAPGKPSEKTVVTVGASNLTEPAALVTEVTDLVPYQGRDLVLARLKQAVFDVTPVSLAATPAAAGETLKIAGFGQTKTTWVPSNLHTGSFTVDGVQGSTLTITGQDSAVCAGDAGGPLFREKDGKIELVGINSRSWQGGCFGADPTETRTGAKSVNVADASALAWLKAEREFVQMADANGDGMDDMFIQNLNGDVTVRTAVTGAWAIGPNGQAYRFREGVRWTGGWANFTGQEGKGRLYFADMNADNKADMIVHSTDGTIAVRLNTGTGFDAGTTWSTGWGNFLGHEGKGRLYFADMNADNKADMIVHSTDGTIAARIRLNVGTAFDGGTTWSTGWGNFLGDEGKGRLYFNDMNADRKADMIVHATDGSLAVRLNIGNGFGSSTTWSSGWGNFLGHEGDGHLYFADSVNDENAADGKADLIIHSPDGKLALRKNTGAAFAIFPGYDWV